MSRKQETFQKEEKWSLGNKGKRATYYGSLPANRKLLSVAFVLQGREKGKEVSGGGPGQKG